MEQRQNCSPEHVDKAHTELELGEALERDIKVALDPRVALAEHLSPEHRQMLEQMMNHSPERERQEREYMFGPDEFKHPRPPKTTKVVKNRKANKAARKARKK